MKLLSTPMGTSPTGGRLWLRWLALAVFVVALAVAFVNLGFWQLARLDQRRAMNSSVVDHENSAVVDFSTVFTRTIVEADQWQRVRVSGTFDADHQFLVRYRSQGEASGYEVVTPLHTTTGQWVLVDRGFGVKANTEDYPTVLPAPPTGTVDIVGYVRRDEQGSTDAMTPVQPSNTIRLVNSGALAATLPYPIVNGFVSAIEMTPAQEGNLVPVQPPELTEGNHFSYAIQWFTFAGIAGIGLVVLIRSDLRAARKPRAPTAANDEGET
ncbi:MAG: SURF1 family protein [Propionicimonas sp.]|uniref:SURF1 family cytochrome oxidase biogenesis protein n=1 Tax=Propionicimonas sp. TaxID=1955623 RepID=UPI003D0FB03F